MWKKQAIDGKRTRATTSPSSIKQFSFRWTDSFQIGRLAIILPKLISSTSGVHEDVQGIVAKRVASDAVITRNRGPAQTQTCQRRSLAGARVICHNEASSLGVVSHPIFYAVVLNSRPDGTIQDDSGGAERSACWLRLGQLVITEANVADTRVEECPVAGFADFVVFDLSSVCLDAVQL